VMDWCADAGFEPNIAFESDDHNVLIGLVAAGVGIALLPQLALRMGYPGAESRPVAGAGLERKIYAAIPSDAYRSPATEAMIDVLRSIADEFQGRTPLPAVVS